MSEPTADDKKRKATARNYLRAAKALIKEGRSESAAELLGIAQDLSPDDREIASSLADAFVRLGRPNEARTIWSSITGTASGAELGKMRTFQRLGREALARGANEEAAGYFEKHLRVSPADDPCSNQLLLMRLGAAPATSHRRLIQDHVASFGAPSLTDLATAIYVDRHDDPSDAATRICTQAQLLHGQRDLAVAAVDALQEMGHSKDAIGLLATLESLFPGDSRFVQRRVRALIASGADSNLVIQAADSLVLRGTDHLRDRIRKMRLLAEIRNWTAVIDEAELLLAKTFDVEVAALAIRGYTRLERDEEIDLLLTRCVKELGGGDTQDQIALARIEVAASRPEIAAARLAPLYRGKTTRAAARTDYAVSVASTGSYAAAWLMLADALHFEAGSRRLQRLAARCAAALDLAPDPRARFPDALFEQALLAKPDRSSTPYNDVVVICTSSLSAGGAERQVALTATHVADRRGPNRRTILLGRDLSARGNSVMLNLATSPCLEIEDMADTDPVAVFRTLCAQGDLDRRMLKLLAAFPEDLYRDIVKLYDRFRTLRPQAVHLWQDGRISAGSVAAVLAGVPKIIASVRNVAPREGDRRRYRPYLAALYRSLGHRADVILTANAAAGATDYEQTYGLQANSIIVLRNGVDGAQIRNRAPASAVSAIRGRLGLGDRSLLVGGVFRLAPAKRPHLWLEIARLVATRLPEVRFAIVGAGVLREELEALASSYGLSERLVFAGAQNPVEPWIAAMDLMLLVSEVEGLPNVVLEAQALGVPVVATNAGGTGEAILDGQTGTLVMDDRPETLADAVHDRLTDVAFLARARALGPDFIDERFGLSRMIDETMAVYDAPLPASVS